MEASDFLLLMAAATGSIPAGLLRDQPSPKQSIGADQERIQEAEAKRQRKAAKRAAANKESEGRG